MHYFITGGAGFIGSNLVDRLLKDGNKVTIYDNFSTGLIENLKEAKSFKDNCIIVKGDLLDIKQLTTAMNGCDFVFHFAANADVRFGLDHPRKDLEQNTIATFNVLEAMRNNNIKKIAFSSTGAIYGEPDIFPTPEACPIPRQTSLYGAAKVAGEGLIEAYCEGFGFQSWIFRFVAILGKRYIHGHVFDFYKKLMKDKNELQVLGDGHQKKSYLDIQDCIDAIIMAIEKAKDKVNIFNLGNTEYCEVNDSIKHITGHLGLKPILKYSGGIRGWIGDSPFVFLDVSKISKLGWRPKYNIKQAVLRTVDYLKANEWLFKKRK